MPRRWSDIFTLTKQRKVGRCGGKTTPADEQTWEGTFDGQFICVVSTVRLMCSNMAHFLTHSGTRIGTYDWNLVGGHFLDLVVHAQPPLNTTQLLILGQLAMTEDTRPVCVRRQGEGLQNSLNIPRPS